MLCNDHVDLYHRKRFCVTNARHFSQRSGRISKIFAVIFFIPRINVQILGMLIPRWLFHRDRFFEKQGKKGVCVGVFLTGRNIRREIFRVQFRRYAVTTFERQFVTWKLTSYALPDGQRLIGERSRGSSIRALLSSATSKTVAAIIGKHYLSNTTMFVRDLAALDLYRYPDYLKLL